MKTLLKKSLALLLTMILCVSMIPANVLATEIKGAVIDSGKCGSNVKYTIYESGLMKITGTGAMKNYNFETDDEDNRPYLDHINKIKKVVIDKGITSIGNLAFLYCSNISSVTIPNGVTRIGESAFAFCSNLTNINIPDSVKSIAYGAFGDTGLVSIKIPNSVTSIEGYAFGSCRDLTSITLPNSIDTISRWMFMYCSSLTSVDIPDSIAEIGANAFWACNSLTSINIPESVKKIGGGAFGCCEKLKDVKLPNSLTNIDDGAFEMCESLTNITIPEKVTSMGGRVFAYCDNLSKIVFKGNAPEFKMHKMYNVSDAFVGVKATVYYTKNNKTWTQGVRKNYGGTLTWKSYERPAAPVIKSANVASSGKIKLTWNKVSGAVKYNIYRSTAKNGAYSIVKTATGTSYTNTSAKAGTNYYYYVTAVSSKDMESKASAKINRTCDYARPNVTVEIDKTTGKPKLKWGEVAGATRYEIYRATSKSGTYSRMKTVSETTYINANASAGKTYYYKVRALGTNNAATSAYSEIDSIRCKLAKPVVKITTSSGKPKVSWAAVTGAKEYKIYRATSKTGKYSLVKTTTSKSWKDTTAKKGKTYYYKVVAVHKNSSANSAYSNVVYKKCTK